MPRPFARGAWRPNPASLTHIRALAKRLFALSGTTMSRLPCVLFLAAGLIACASDAAKGDSSSMDVASGREEAGTAPASSDAESAATAQPPGATASSPGTLSPATEGASTEMLGETRGAFSLYLPEHAGCRLGGQWLDFPRVDEGHPVDGQSHDTLVSDAELSPVVSCTWFSQEAPYRAALGITIVEDGSSRYVSLAPPLTIGEVHEHGFRVKPGGDSPALRSPEGGACEFTAIEVDLTRQSVWGSMHCDVLTDDTGTEHCPDASGYFYFENCTPR